MREKMKEILKQTLSGEMGTLELNIDGERYTRIFRPKERLILLGGGHIAKALCTFASMIDFQVIVVDDRPSFANTVRFPEAKEVICNDFNQAIHHLKVGAGDYVAIITRGHRYDATCIRSILEEGNPAYIGLLGSRRRTSALISQLKEEGLEENRLDSIHTPIGLNIGALTVEEIAVSIIAELIKERRTNQRKSVQAHLLAEETFHEDVLIDLVENDVPKALLMVYDTSGSTPVKSGCFMTVDRGFIPKGTIGGGCIESEALKEAFRLIGTHSEKTIQVDLNNDVAEEEGMVCGGTMKVYLADLS